MGMLSVALVLCDGNPPLTGGCPSQRASDEDIWCFFDVSANKLLNKHSSGRWCETPRGPCAIAVIQQANQEGQTLLATGDDMMTPSNGNIFLVTGHLCGEFTGHQWIPRTKPVTRSFDVFCICVWTNGWVNNREAGDLRCYRAHYDVIVMNIVSFARQLGYLVRLIHFYISCGILSHFVGY